MTEKNSLSVEDVRHVATLARLKLTEEEEKMFSEQLSSVLGYIGQLDELDTDGVEPTSHALNMSNVFREDVAEERFEKGGWKKNAPSEDHAHFRVPKIIDG